MLTCDQIREVTPFTVEYAKGAPEKIGHSVSVLVDISYFNETKCSIDVEERTVCVKWYLLCEC